MKDSLDPKFGTLVLAGDYEFHTFTDLLLSPALIQFADVWTLGCECQKFNPRE